ncbi:hypothetical protein Tco_0491127 [Tanacetum coccineum]
MKKKCMDKGSKERSPPHNLGRNWVNTYAVRITMLIADIEDDIMDPVMQCTTLPSHSGFSQKKLVSFVTEIHTTSIDFLTPKLASMANLIHRVSKAYAFSLKPVKEISFESTLSQISSLSREMLVKLSDESKYEHWSRYKIARWQRRSRQKDIKVKDLGKKKTKSKDNDKGSRSKITKHEGTSLQRRQRQRSQELNDKSNLIDLTKECHNELTSGEIVSLKNN